MDATNTIAISKLTFSTATTFWQKNKRTRPGPTNKQGSMLRKVKSALCLPVRKASPLSHLQTLVRGVGLRWVEDCLESSTHYTESWNIIAERYTCCNGLATYVYVYAAIALSIWPCNRVWKVGLYASLDTTQPTLDLPHCASGGGACWLWRLVTQILLIN